MSFHPFCRVGEECVVALQKYIPDWHGVGHRSAVIETMHVRAHRREKGRINWLPSMETDLGRVNDLDASFSVLRGVHFSQCHPMQRVSMSAKPKEAMRNTAYIFMRPIE